MQGPRLFLSTLSLRRATCQYPRLFPLRSISIHALLAESDATTATTSWCARYFYPRSPCGERRSGTKSVNGDRPFLSTLSLRRATCNNCIFCFCHKISIHALLAESDVSLSIMMQLCEISIHALLAESDFEAGRAGMQAALFLSTLSLRRATSTSAKRWMPTEFLSTLSLRRATGRFAKRGGKAVFLSTLSLRRATAPSANGADPLRYFYPRSPCGERPILGNPCAGCPAISIHALLAESDGCRCPPRHWHGGFLSTLSLRRATSSRKLPSSWRRFLSTLSLRRATGWVHQ